MSVSTNARAITAVTQAFLWGFLAVFLVGFLVSKSCRQRIPQMADEAGIESVGGDKGVKFRERVESISLKLVQENTNLHLQLTPIPKNQDIKPGKAAADLLTTVQESKPALSGPPDFWVYVGEYDDQKKAFRSPATFDVAAPPTVNSKITAVGDVYQRDSKPNKVEGQWKLGQIKGVLPKGTTVTVLEVAKIEGENKHDYNSWVRVKLE